MIYGIGIDLVEIERLREVIGKWGERFLGRIFTEGEIAYCKGKTDIYPSMAIRFAAKEALIKAVGGGAQVSFRDIEIISVDGGKPRLEVRGKLREFFDKEGIRGVHLSLSHEKDYGAACVVLERD